jgi:hypothetical protein
MSKYQLTNLKKYETIYQYKSKNTIIDRKFVVCYFTNEQDKKIKNNK